MDKVKEQWENLKTNISKIDWSKLRPSKTNSIKRGHRSVKWPITILLTIVMLVPLLAALLFSYIQTTKIMTERVEAQEEQITTNIVSTIDSAATAAETTVEKLAMDSILNQVSSGTPGAESQLSSRLQYISSGNRYISDAYYIPIGENQDIISTNTLNDNDSLNEQLPWLESASQSNGIQWSEPYTLNGSSRIAVSRPLFGGQSVIGVLAVDLDFETIKKDVEEAKIANTGSIQIFTEDGIVLASPDTSIIGQNHKEKSYFQTILNEESDSDTGLIYDEEANGGELGIYYEKIPNLGITVFGMVAENEMDEETSAIIKTFITITVITIIVAAVISYYAAGIITSIANSMMKTFGEVRRGNLTNRLGYKELVNFKNPYVFIKNKLSKNNNETVSSNTGESDLDPKGNEIHQIAIAFNETMDTFESTIAVIQGNSKNVSEMAATLTELSDQTSRATSEVAQTISGVAEATSTQTEDTEETASQMNDLSQALNEINDAVGTMGSHADNTMILNGNNIFATQDVDQNWKETLGTMDQLKAQIEEVDGDIQNIEGIVNAITNIAKKTNLLALNASIEAARAGEDGKGFAVVAEEIRKLAEQSRSFNEEIAEVILNLMNQTKGAVSAVSNVQNITAEQQKNLADTNEQFDFLSKAFNTLENVIDQVSQTEMKMKTKTEDMIDIMNNLSVSSEENASTIEELSATISTTNEEIENMFNEVKSINKQVKTLEKVILFSNYKESLSKIAKD
ncbi:methyl-accepting chemotaxis protein [Marinilactibacillus psychrotolerans]|uniref:methyl-accepting chemotaxis protein n=2 Tax=Bacillota TaxID=1239 RepID=UPI003885AD6F